MTVVHSSRKKNSAREKAMYSKARASGEAILLDEIQLAIQWDRPSILLAVHSSEIGRVKTQQSFTRALKKNNLRVVGIKIGDHRSDFIQKITQTPDLDKIIFYVTGLDDGGGANNLDAYKTLNLHRESFVENRVRVVFWLTKREALTLPLHAPDFWAFRHRVVEFASTRGSMKKDFPAGLFLWDSSFHPMRFEELKSWIASREEILSRLPDDNASMATRMETLLLLARARWSIGDLQNAGRDVASALEFANDESAAQFRGQVLNAQGIISFEKDGAHSASSLLKKALDANPQNAILAINLSIAYHAAGRNRDALVMGQRAVRWDAGNPSLWHVMGCLYLSMGRFDDAATCAAKALELNPDNMDYHYSLAIISRAAGRLDDCNHQLERIASLFPERDPTKLAYEDIMTGNREKALRLLKTTLGQGDVCPACIRRDPNLYFLLEKAEIESLN